MKGQIRSDAYEVICKAFDLDTEERMEVLYGTSDILAAKQLQEQQSDWLAIEAQIINYYIKWGFPKKPSHRQRLKLWWHDTKALLR